MGLTGTAIPRDFAFNILLQNCVERQAVYERAFPANWGPSCSLAPCCLLSNLPSNEPGCSRSRSNTVVMARHYGSTPPGKRRQHSQLPVEFPCSAPQRDGKSLKTTGNPANVG